MTETNMKEMFSRQTIARRVEELAEQLNADYAGREVVFVCILKGAAIFIADLVRQLKFDVRIEFMKVASYEGTASTGKIDFSLDIGSDISGKDVVIVEDIIDTGNTLSFLSNHLAAKNPASVKICVLLDNPTRRGEECLSPDYTAFVIPNQFVVGYGLDYNGKYRHLPFIATLMR
ncbi:MAG: hypoxanthine phosphoribosyltransferase [Defluviitaleaceae bacterium]|nr:hypoxanthine phosphoribosyltransferase [Defluviitaleaceae bacterium]